MSDVIYVATPYTDPNPAVRDGRWHLANLGAAYIIKNKKTIVYAPITMTDPLDRVMAGSSNTLGSDYWVKFDETFMAACSSITVFKIPGWEKSGGVTREIKHFKDIGKPVEYLEPEKVFSSLTKEELQAIPANAWLALSDDIVKKYKPEEPAAPVVPPKADILYVAAPYSDPRPSVREGRQYLANLAATHIIETRKIVVYAPAAMAAPVEKMAELDADYRIRTDEAYMAGCSSIVVLKIPGWDKSAGVTREIGRFEETGRPVEYMEPADLLATLTKKELQEIPAKAWRVLPDDVVRQFKPETSTKPAKPIAPKSKTAKGCFKP